MHPDILDNFPDLISPPEWGNPNLLSGFTPPPLYKHTICPPNSNPHFSCLRRCVWGPSPLILSEDELEDLRKIFLLTLRTLTDVARLCLIYHIPSLLLQASLFLSVFSTIFQFSAKCKFVCANLSAWPCGARQFCTFSRAHNCGKTQFSD